MCIIYLQKCLFHVQAGPVIMEGDVIQELGVPLIVIVKQHGKEITVNKVGYQTHIRSKGPVYVDLLKHKN